MSALVEHLLICPLPSVPTQWGQTIKHSSYDEDDDEECEDQKKMRILVGDDHDDKWSVFSL